MHTDSQVMRENGMWDPIYLYGQSIHLNLSLANVFFFLLSGRCKNRVYGQMDVFTTLLTTERNDETQNDV